VNDDAEPAQKPSPAHQRRKSAAEDRVDRLGDRFSDFEQFVRGEFRKVAEDLRATERRQEDHRRQVIKEMSAAMELMAQNVRRLSE